MGGGEESLAQSTGVMDIWKGRCRERACIVIDKLVGRKMERISKHFFAFILNYFSFLCGKFVMVSKMESFLSEKLLFDFFMKLNALLSEEWATCHKT